MVKKKVLCAVILLIIAVSQKFSFSQDNPKIHVLEINGVIDPVIAGYVEEGIKEAELNKTDAVVFVLDTPGGLLDSTRTIIQEMLNTDIPVIVYVAPKGARAASAGVFITMASDVAAMAPLTHIGAAHPVSLGGGFPVSDSKKEDSEEKKEDKNNSEKAEQSSVMEEKVLSDASAYMESLARDKNRNWEWAVEAVRKSVSITAEEAKKKNVIEYIAENMDSLLEMADGREIIKNKKTMILKLKDAVRTNFPMSAIKRFLHTIANPNIAYMLMILGFYGLVYEFSSPGIGFGAVVGTISLILAFYALQVLPVNYVGLMLLVLGIILMLLDLKIASHGILTIGGLTSFVLGSFFLIDSSEAYLRVSGSVIAGVATATLLFIGYALKKVIESHLSKPVSGKEGLIGEQGEVREALNPEGMIYVHGEYWRAVSSQPCPIGEKVTVKEIKNNKLIVEKVGG